MKILTLFACVTLLGCSSAANHQALDTIGKGLDTADQLCPVVLAQETFIRMAAEKAGIPLDEYARQACKAVAVVSPLVRSANDGAACPAYPWALSGVGGAAPIAPSVAGSSAAP